MKALSPSGIRKFFELLYTMDDVISLGVGEPDFVTPWRIRESAIYSIEKGYTMYTSNFGLMELRQEISGYIKQTNRAGVQPGQPGAGDGGSEPGDRSGHARPH